MSAEWEEQETHLSSQLGVHALLHSVSWLNDMTLMFKFKCEVLGLPISPDKLHDGEELLVTAALLPLLQHRHEEEAKAGPHHHPVNCAWQVGVHSLVEWRCPVFQIPGFNQVSI